MTRREIVLDGLRAAGGFRSAQQLHADLRDGGERIGLATVYRVLASMSESGAVDTRRTDSGEVHYRLCRSGGHHHHLSCRTCGTAVELDAAVVETWVGQVGRQHGFTGVDHVVELVGICASCRTDEDG